MQLYVLPEGKLSTTLNNLGYSHFTQYVRIYYTRGTSNLGELGYYMYIIGVDESIKLLIPACDLFEISISSAQHSHIPQYMIDMIDLMIVSVYNTPTYGAYECVSPDYRNVCAYPGAKSVPPIYSASSSRYNIDTYFNIDKFIKYHS